MNDAPPEYDAVIIGGGPGGSTTAIAMARAGLKVCVLEKDHHPRFHIGESILPRNMAVIRELGLEAELKKLPHLTKLGAEFGMGNDHNTMTFRFADGLVEGSPVFNIERSHFDKMLIDQARLAGAEVLEGVTVRKINRLEEGYCEVATADRTFSGRVLMDASGHGTVVGRHLGQRRNFDDPNLQKVAYFQHFENVERLSGDATGHPTIIMCDEGWFWLIGLTDTKTSVGFVTRPSFVKELNVAPDRLLQWAIARCPVVRHRMRRASGEPTNRVLADFSYTCAPHAGPGFFLIGDAGAFLDPIFSTGVTLAMNGGCEAAKLAMAVMKREMTPAAAQAAYVRFVKGSTFVLWRLIRRYYRHSFRELFLHGRGPHDVHRAIISILAGQVFPRPVWALRWRLRLFEVCEVLNRFVPMVPRRPRFSLVAEQPVQLPQIATGAMATV
jgi:flavin-dependent dehydrogenase